MKDSKASKLRVNLPSSSNMSHLSTGKSILLISQKPSKLYLYKRSEFNQDPFGLNNIETNSNSGNAPAENSDYQLEKQLDLGLGNLLLVKHLKYETESGFLVVSNDKVLVFLDEQLNEVFRNELLQGAEDLCFFTAADCALTSPGNFQGTFALY